jgi:hypothetical protein
MALVPSLRRISGRGSGAVPPRLRRGRRLLLRCRVGSTDRPASAGPLSPGPAGSPALVSIPAVLASVGEDGCPVSDPEDGPASARGRVWTVHWLPSHARSEPVPNGSGYQPGEGFGRSTMRGGTLGCRSSRSVSHGRAWPTDRPLPEMNGGRTVRLWRSSHARPVIRGSVESGGWTRREQGAKS